MTQLQLLGPNQSARAASPASIAYQIRYTRATSPAHTRGIPHTPPGRRTGPAHRRRGASPPEGPQVHRSCVLLHIAAEGRRGCKLLERAMGCTPAGLLPWAAHDLHPCGPAAMGCTRLVLMGCTRLTLILSHGLHTTCSCWLHAEPASLYAVILPPPCGRIEASPHRGQSA